MKIRNIELEFNFNDADDMEKLENAIDETTKKLNNIKIEGKRTSEVIKENCMVIFDCFNMIFGKGTDKKIFGEKTSLDVCKEAFEDLCKSRVEQEDVFVKEMNSLESKYGMNRAQRRKKK